MFGSGHDSAITVARLAERFVIYSESPLAIGLRCEHYLGVALSERFGLDHVVRFHNLNLSLCLLLLCHRLCVLAVEGGLSSSSPILHDLPLSPWAGDLRVPVLTRC